MVHRSGRGGSPSVQEGWREDVIPVYRRLAERVHQHGTRIFAEIGHAGPLDEGSAFLDNVRPLLSPSGISPFSSSESPRPMEEDDFAALTEGFATTARNVKLGGLDGVEIHAAHGYLLSTFFSPWTNTRADAYGGSTENRCRFAIEIGRAVRDVVGPEFPIGMRYSFDDFTVGGVDPVEGERILKVLHSAGLFTYFSISGGIVPSSPHKLISPMTEDPLPLASYAACAKEIVGPDTPVLSAHQVTTLEQAEDMIASGVADLVGMVRAHLADPFLVKKTQEGKPNTVRRCINCNQGCIGRINRAQLITCTVNPASGREGTWGDGSIAPAHVPQRVLIVGAGPSGLKCAEIAGQRGHAVVVLERGDFLGGNVRYASMMPKRSRWDLLIDNFERSVSAANVDLRLATKATVELVTAEEPDAIVLATGSHFEKNGFSSGLTFREFVPGLETSTVLSPIEALTNPDLCGGKVLIVDDSGDYLPLGLAESLALAGKDVEVLSRHMSLGAEVAPTFELGGVMGRLAKLGVRISAQQYLVEVTAGSVSVASIWGGAQRTLEIESIVFNMRRIPNSGLYEALRPVTAAPIYRVGDCIAPRHVDEAIYEGEALARSL